MGIGCGQCQYRLNVVTNNDLGLQCCYISRGLKGLKAYKSMVLCHYLGPDSLKLTVMARSKEISLETRQSVVVLQSEGYSMRAIAKKLKISLHGVHSCLARKAETGSNIDRKRCGRPKMTSQAEDKHIRVCSLRNRYLTCPEITSDLNSARKQAGEKAVSSSTVRRRLKAAGLTG